jgi:hypothetical protein
VRGREMLGEEERTSEGRKAAREITGGQSEEKNGNMREKWWKRSSDGAERARGCSGVGAVIVPGGCSGRWPPWPEC